MSVLGEIKVKMPKQLGAGEKDHLQRAVLSQINLFMSGEGQ